MYGLPEHESLAFLIGRELIQLLVGQFQLILRFDGDTEISIEGPFQHQPKGTPLEGTVELPYSAATLLTLLGQRIVGSRNLGGGEIQLTFSNGDILRLQNGTDDSESYEIRAPNVQIIV